MASGFREGGGSGNGLSAKTLHICGKDDKICVTCFSVFLVQTKGREGMKSLMKPLQQGQMLEVGVCLWSPVSVTWLPGDTTPHYIIFYRRSGVDPGFQKGRGARNRLSAKMLHVCGKHLPSQEVMQHDVV